MKPGDYVGYRSSLKDSDFSHKGYVLEFLPKGIPSCREPMVAIKGKAGLVLQSHCTVLAHLPPDQDSVTLKEKDLDQMLQAAEENYASMPKPEDPAGRWIHKSSILRARECTRLAKIGIKAPRLLSALKELLRVDDAWQGSVNSEMAAARQEARVAIKELEE